MSRAHSVSRLERDWKCRKHSHAALPANLVFFVRSIGLNILIATVFSRNMPRDQVVSRVFCPPSAPMGRSELHRFAGGCLFAVLRGDLRLLKRQPDRMKEVVTRGDRPGLPIAAEVNGGDEQTIAVPRKRGGGGSPKPWRLPGRRGGNERYKGDFSNRIGRSATWGLSPKWRLDPASRSWSGRHPHARSWWPPGPKLPGSPE
jgi:hypothetical protein